MNASIFYFAHTEFELLSFQALASAQSPKNRFGWNGIFAWKPLRLRKDAACCFCVGAAERLPDYGRITGKVMRAGILIVGSLLWDEESERPPWRQSRLVMDRAVHVKVPIRYGRLSKKRGKTFTMTFAADSDPLGQGVLVPCRASPSNVAELAAEAEALWKAEHSSAKAGSIAAAWGCVGALFHGDLATSADWSREWAERKVLSIPPVDSNGLLSIPWPSMVDGTAAGVDIVLATATEAEVPSPDPERIAKAWTSQDKGCERYFFQNVKHGIRTPDDLAIWLRIREIRPD